MKRERQLSSCERGLKLTRNHERRVNLFILIRIEHTINEFNVITEYDHIESKILAIKRILYSFSSDIIMSRNRISNEAYNVSLITKIDDFTIIDKLCKIRDQKLILQARIED